jgi:hypothetical protein
MNVWTLVYKGSRYVVGAKNRKEASEIIGCSDEYMRSNGGLTHDPKEIDAAHAAPRTKIVVGSNLKRPKKRSA